MFFEVPFLIHTNTEKFGLSDTQIRLLFLKLMFFLAEITPQESFGQKSSANWRTNDKLNLLSAGWRMSFAFCLLSFLACSG